MKAPQKYGGPLFVLAVIFAISAALRIAIHADAAFAVITHHSNQKPTQTTATDCTPNVDISPILIELNTRQQELDDRDSELIKTEAALSVIRNQIDQQLQEIEVAENRLAELISMSQSASKNDLAQLSAVYAAMNPKQSAALFETMDPDFAAGFLTMLEPAIAAEIMAGISAEKAYALSVIVAGRNASAPTE